jgi:hypothetical protein
MREMLPARQSERGGGGSALVKRHWQEFWLVLEMIDDISSHGEVRVRTINVNYVKYPDRSCTCRRSMLRQTPRVPKAPYSNENLL